MTSPDLMNLAAARPPIRRAPLLRGARAGPAPRSRFVVPRLAACQRHRLEVALTVATPIATGIAIDRPPPAYAVAARAPVRNVACRPDSSSPVGNVFRRPAARRRKTLAEKPWMKTLDGPVCRHPTFLPAPPPPGSGFWPAFWTAELLDAPVSNNSTAHSSAASRRAACVAPSARPGRKTLDENVGWSCPPVSNVFAGGLAARPGVLDSRIVGRSRVQ